MSYILDALRRAQAERERGQVPGLHAQPGLAGAHRVRTAAGAAAVVRPAWLWALAGAGLLALLLVPLWWALRGPVVPGATVLPGATRVAPAVQPAPTTGQPPAPAPAPLVVVSAAPAPKSATKPAATAAAALTPPTVAVPAARPELSPGAAAGAASVAVAPEPALPVQARPQATSPAAAVQPPALLPPTLTPDQRRDWPPLAVGGSVWSDTPSARFVILGGQVVREGDTTADGVLVERITPKAVVLRWRDQRGSLPF